MGHSLVMLLLLIIIIDTKIILCDIRGLIVHRAPVVCLFANVCMGCSVPDRASYKLASSAFTSENLFSLVVLGLLLFWLSIIGPTPAQTFERSAWR